jgi:hypothetical protein
MTPNIADIIRQLVSPSVRCLDRIYVHGYMPKLQPQAASYFLHDHVRGRCATSAGADRAAGAGHSIQAEECADRASSKRTPPSARRSWRYSAMDHTAGVISSDDVTRGLIPRQGLN